MRLARAYDPLKLGFVVNTACSQQDCVVDTAQIGDGNGGHLWGKDRSDSDRMPFWNISGPTDAG